MVQDCSDGRSGDFLRNPLSAGLWWGLPLVIGFSAGFLPVLAVVRTLAWAAAFAWMGTGCALNARRCGRLHCFISAPVLFLGAVAVTLAAFGWVPLGARTPSYLIDGSLVLALQTFLVEPIWGMYRTR